jgi:O-acetyl-ADP-ribose deacetylase (regulator of RNase III)
MQTKSIKIVIGNVETSGAEAIVNAANSLLKRGGGVCGAIFKAAGEMDLASYLLKTFDGCKTGKAVVSPAFQLESLGTKHIIHAVGPHYEQYDARDAARFLRKAYQSIFEISYALGLKSVAVVAISAGIYKFPIRDVARIAVSEARRTSFNGEILFYVWTENAPFFERALAKFQKKQPDAQTSSIGDDQSDSVNQTADVDDLVTVGQL